MVGLDGVCMERARGGSCGIFLDGEIDHLNTGETTQAFEYHHLSEREGRVGERVSGLKYSKTLDINKRVLELGRKYSVLEIGIVSLTWAPGGMYCPNACSN